MANFRNAGQTCVFANQRYVQSGIYKELSEKLAERVAAFNTGDGFGDGVIVGPLIIEPALSKVGVSDKIIELGDREIFDAEIIVWAAGNRSNHALGSAVDLEVGSLSV